MNEQSRRGFLRQAALLAASLPGVALLIKTLGAYAGEKADVPVPAGLKPVSESDPIAVALGFHQDAQKTDFSHYPDRKTPSSQNQFCKTCGHFTALNEGWGKCEMMTTGVVSSRGWCGSWIKKT